MTIKACGGVFSNEKNPSADLPHVSSTDAPAKPVASVQGREALPEVVWRETEPGLPISRAREMSIAAFELGFAMLGLFHFGAQVTVPETLRAHPIAGKLLEQYQAAFAKVVGEPSPIIKPGHLNGA